MMEKVIKLDQITTLGLFLGAEETVPVGCKLWRGEERHNPCEWWGWLPQRGLHSSHSSAALSLTLEPPGLCLGSFLCIQSACFLLQDLLWWLTNKEKHRTN